MNLANRITALLCSLTTLQIRAMSPVDKQQLCNECLPVLQAAMPPQAQIKAGVLYELKRGDRPQ
ncbi:MAG: hypothetical protein J2P50_00235 [Hyphomicrobiaceae bacterium]|nr:hypothetical protein [Hyphomicrobiaceae bacterium]